MTSANFPARPSRCSIATALLLVLALGACSNLPGPAGQAPAGTPATPAQPAAEYWLKGSPAAARGEAPSRIESLLLYYDYLRGLAGPELAREYEQLRQAANADKSDFTRLRHALVLALPSSGPRDHGRAQQLLEPLREAKTIDPALRAFAALLHSDLAERRRLEDSLQSATARQKEEQARAADLQQKLDALKAIEKSIAERKSAPAAARPAAPKK